MIDGICRSCLSGISEHFKESFEFDQSRERCEFRELSELGGIGWHLTSSRNFGDDRKFRRCRNSKDSHKSSTCPNFQIPCSPPLFFALPPPPQPPSPLNPPSPPSSLSSSPLWCCHHTSFFLACVLLSLFGWFCLSLLLLGAPVSLPPFGWWCFLPS